MRQVIQSFKTGELTVADVPAPLLRSEGILVSTKASLVSTGTERMVVDFAQGNLLRKARSRPDLVRQALDKARREGILTTLDAVRNRLDQPLGLGYSSAGVVIDIGTNNHEFQIGDRVACAGGGYAVHAEIAFVPSNLAVSLPDNVDFEAAAFTTLGAIALQGIRLAEVHLGEVVAVIGLGLLGQLTVQMLKAAGCIVAGMDIRPERAELAGRLGANAVATNPEELFELCHLLSHGHGADATLITADTKSNQPVEVAGEVARDKGIVVAVGAVGMTIPRKAYYEKELDFRISRAYGPGRYDPQYEEHGQDYPYGYVRWTEQRNMQAFVRMVSERHVDIHPLITHRFSIDDAPKAYDLITGKINEPFLGVVLAYPGMPEVQRRIPLHSRSPKVAQPIDAPDLSPRTDRVKLGVVGAGSFANAVLLPTLKDVPGVELLGIVSGSGLSAQTTGSRFGFAYCASDMWEVLNDPAINTVALLTRHNLHARQVIAALQAGKHVFVEKPLCLNAAELRSILSTYAACQEHGKGRSPLLMVGFNRRYAPFVVELKRYLQRLHEPLMFNYRVNAGYIPPQHWSQDPAHGGRLLGEACHFIDLLIYLSGSLPHEVLTSALPDGGRYSHDNLLITLKLANGSLGTVTYLANGDKGFGKECLEVFGGGLAARLDDYRTLLIRHGTTRVKRVARLRQDKGHKAEWQAIVAYLIGNGAIPMAIQEVVQSTRATLAAQRSLERGTPVNLDTEWEE